MIPPFTSAGVLPPGIHPATWEEICARFGGNPRREWLLAGLYRAARALKLAGCTTLYLDGSFVTAKPDPKDFDACWEGTQVVGARLDPVLLDLSGKRLKQKLKYRGELFPAQAEADALGTLYIDFFQTDKETGLPKGLIALDLRGFR